MFHNRKPFVVIAFSFIAITLHATLHSGKAGSWGMPPWDGKMRPSAMTGVAETYFPTLAPSSHAANLLLLRKGDVLCFWFSGKEEGTSGVGIVYSRLAKGAEQWTKPVLITKQKGESFQNPVPFEAPDGTIWLLHTTQPADEGQKNSSVLLIKSHDGGKTWSKPKVLFGKPGSFIRDPIVERSDGSWLLPMYFTPSEGIRAGAETHYSVIKISNNQGRTWKDCTVPDSHGLVQPSVVHPQNGPYIAFFRSRYADWIFRSTSPDGCSWSAPQATELPNNNASIQAVLLKDGNIALAFNNVNAGPIRTKPRTGPRKPLSVALSKDGGKTWPWIRNIQLGASSGIEGAKATADHSPDEYSYPSIIQMPNGKIGVAYTYRRQTIKFVIFNENWIKQRK